MAKITNYAALLFAILLAIVLQPSLSDIAFAYVQNDMYSHSHATALTDPNLVCGDHICSPGETSHNPKAVEPVKERR